GGINDGFDGFRRRERRKVRIAGGLLQAAGEIVVDRGRYGTRGGVGLPLHIWIIAIQRRRDRQKACARPRPPRRSHGGFVSAPLEAVNHSDRALWQSASRQARQPGGLSYTRSLTVE